MPTDEERLKAAQLRVATMRSPEQVRAAAERAQQAGKRSFNNTIKVKEQGDDFVTYSVRGPGGVVEQLAFQLSWTAAEDGTTTVVTVPGRYVTVRSTMFGIPYGKRRVPALRSFEQFAEWMRKEVAS